MAANPNAGQFTVDALTGQLTFGAALPATGEVVANYHLGQWERLAFLIAGELAVTVRAAEADDVAALTAGIGRALAGPNRLAGLKRLALVAVDAIGIAEDALGDTRGQTARYTFEYEHIVNAPASSGGIIQIDAHHHQSAPPAPRRGNGSADRGHDHGNRLRGDHR